MAAKKVRYTVLCEIVCFSILICKTRILSQSQPYSKAFMIYSQTFCNCCWFQWKDENLRLMFIGASVWFRHLRLTPQNNAKKTAKNKHKNLVTIFRLKSDIYIASFRYTHSEKSIQVTTKPLQFSQVRGCEHTRENNYKLQTTFLDNISKIYICRIYYLYDKSRYIKFVPFRLQ